MRFLLHFVAVALLTAVGIGGMDEGKAAERDPRAAVLGRQRIRAELSAAMAKGYLTRMDQFSILLHAKDLLSDDDLHGLEQTLNRIAAQQAAAHRAAHAPREVINQQDGDDDPRPEVVMPTKYDQTAAEVITPSKHDEAAAEVVPAIGEPTPAKGKPHAASPFVEEGPASIGKPAIHLDEDDQEPCDCEPECCPRCRWIDITASMGVDGFKGPIDIGNANGNFGLRAGVNAAVPLIPSLGIGLQAGTNIVLSNLKGSPYPEPNNALRDQYFVTTGMFQRINREAGSFTWGGAYDWLFDNYYSGFDFGQWRVKGSWEFNPCNEIGITAAIPDHGSSTTVYIPNENLLDYLRFKPIAQGYLYWKHTWDNEASLMGKLGLAEKPGSFVFGAETRLPLTRNVAATGSFTYIMPAEGAGGLGQMQEIWNVSFGLEFTPGGFCRTALSNFHPFLPVADNGTMAVRELGF